jgi:hypothetical protein
MKLSLWQHFSSNHSAGFSLIGQFQNAQEATQAGAVIRSILEKIADWYKTHPELDFEVRGDDLVNLTPVEAELARQYGLEKAWEYSVDWAEVEVDPQLANRGLYTFDKLVFLHNAIETWVGPQPFDDLLKKLGATVEVSVEGITETEPVVNLTCRAPDATKAAEIVARLCATRTHVTSDSDYTEALIKLPGKQPPYKGLIQNDGARIECAQMPTSTLSFKPAKLIHAAEFLPELHTYLKSQGCTDFDLSISSKPLE